ncbi:MAG: YybS family protein [Desulfobacterales bacterium]|nr:YybS family protein [Desulfobacterales bacterium]
MTHVTHGQRHKELVMAIAITSLIAMAALYLPGLGLLVGVFIPIPVLFYRSKLGRSRGAMILIATTLIIASTMHWRSVPFTVFFFEMGLVGFILSEIFEMNLSVEKTVAATTGVIVATWGLMWALYELLSANSLWGLMSNYLTKNFELALAMYREMEVSEEKINILAQSMEGILYVVLRTMPAIVIASTLFVVWSNILLARPLLRSKQLFCPDFGALNEWKAPEQLVWLVIGSGVLLLVPRGGPRLLGLNVLIIMTTIYFFQGIAIVSFYFEKKRVPRMLRGILYCLIAIQQLLLLLVAAVGLFDMWADFRRIKKRSGELNESNT